MPMCGHVGASASSLRSVIDIVADAVHFFIRAHVMALRHAFGDRSAEYERDSPLPSDLPFDD